MRTIKINDKEYNITTHTVADVGECRVFGDVMKNKVYQVKEVLENPEISMLWRWDSGICPHCKKRIVREIKHDFYRIEILVDVVKKDEGITLDDLYLSGDTMDKRKMKIPKNNETFIEVLRKSKFKGLVV